MSRREGVQWNRGFASHQAAEKSLKGLLQTLGIDAWGHSTTFLMKALPAPFLHDERAQSLMDRCRELDKHYVLARYPDAHPDGAPMDFYTAGEALRAIAAAREVLDFVRQSKDVRPGPG